MVRECKVNKPCEARRSVWQKAVEAVVEVLLVMVSVGGTEPEFEYSAATEAEL